MPAAQVADSSMSHPLKGAVEIIQNRVYYCALKAHPRPDLSIATSSPTTSPTTQRKSIHFFNIDHELVYWNFFLDFGPLNLGQLYRFCTRLNKKLSCKELASQVICFYSSINPAKRANAIFLICAWQVLYLGRTPEEAIRGFTASPEDKNEPMVTEDGTSNHSGSSSDSSNKPQNCSVSPPSPRNSVGAATVSPLPPFHDASPCMCTYDLNILDCLQGLAKARMYGFFDFEDFDVEEYEYFEQVENGDLNWIMKDRFLAFAGPHFKKNISPEGYCTLTPKDYIPYFQRKNVAVVVRLNKKCYDENEFVQAGIQHMEHYYLDGSCPPMKILNKVVEAFENVPSDKAIAVHCKAGLGRTGTCIGAYLMKHYKFTAAEVIAWMRICRPGCVIGPQQHFLQDIEQRMWHEGSVMREKPTTQIVSLLSKNKDENDAAEVSSIVRDDRKRKSRTTNHIKDLAMSHRENGNKGTSTILSSLHFGSLTVQEQRIKQQMQEEKEKTEAVAGRVGQGEALLLARRSQTQQQQQACLR